MIDLYVGLERCPADVECTYVGVGNVTSSNDSLFSAEILDEIIVVGGLHTIQKQSNCEGWDLRVKE